MKPMKFAVVDVETTGGFAADHGITEVGIVVTDGKNVLDEFSSLVNPKQHIPMHITQLTGITNQMVAKAPTFAALVPRIKPYFEGAIFVAHNVDFDFAFMRSEMKRAGHEFNAQKLCTVRYARSLLKDQPKFNLARLAQRFNIVNNNPHRALADAQTAAQILHNLLALDHTKLINKKIVQMAKDVKLPRALPPDQFHNLPHAPGVYYFYNSAQKPEYIGKAKDIKARVTTHFRNAGSAKTQSFMRNIARIDFRLTGTELMALILEDVEIRKHWPPHNRAQKRNNHAFHVISFSDVAGNLRLGIKKARFVSGAHKSFLTLRAAQAYLFSLVETYRLDPTLCGLPILAFHHERPTAAQHSEILTKILEESANDNRHAILLFKGRTNAELAFIETEKGIVKAIGFAPKHIDFSSPEKWRAFAEPIYSSPTIEQLVATSLAQKENERPQIVLL